MPIPDYQATTRSSIGSRMARVLAVRIAEAVQVILHNERSEAEAIVRALVEADLAAPIRGLSDPDVAVELQPIEGNRDTRSATPSAQ